MASAKKNRQFIIQVKKKFDGINISSSKIKKLVEAVFNHCPDNKNRETIVSIAIVNDAEIRKLNSIFLSRKSATDCLSFDLSDNHRPQSPKLFELIVNGQMAVRQANLRGHSSRAELALYITHGLLHNLGFDDSTDTKAKKMHDMEDKILQQLGYGLVYNRNIKVQ